MGSGRTRRPVYQYGNYPRIVSGELAPAYKAKSGQTDSVPIGYIPDSPEETYAYFDGSYAHANEHQLSLGESTTTAKLFTLPASRETGRALLSIEELTHIA